MPNGFPERNKLFSKHNHPIDHLAEAASLLSGIALYPQAFKIFATKTVDDIAPTTFLIVFLTSTIWIGYGRHRKSLPLLISGSLNMVSSALILGMFLLFQR